MTVAVATAVAVGFADHPRPAFARQPATEPARRRASSRPDWLVPTLHTAGLFVTMRIGASLLWSETFDPARGRRNSRTFVRSWYHAPSFDPDAGFFQWDGDPWTINLLGHGVMGSEIYLRHRQAGHPVIGALAMTAIWSFLWEYLIEGWHKHPSAVDLLWTPLGGALFGAGRYWLYRAVQRIAHPVWRHVVLYLVDPLGQLERDLLGAPH